MKVDQIDGKELTEALCRLMAVSSTSVDIWIRATPLEDLVFIASINGPPGSTFYHAETPTKAVDDLCSHWNPEKERQQEIAALKEKLSKLEAACPS